MLVANQSERLWIPAFAGMTSLKINRDGLLWPRVCRRSWQKDESIAPKKRGLMNIKDVVLSRQSRLDSLAGRQVSRVAGRSVKD
jgi:hypothetical protein